jgi:cholinesterase
MRNQSSTALLAAMAKTAGFGPTVDEVVVFSDYLNRSAAGDFIKNPMLLGNTNFEAGLFRAVDAVAGVFLPEAFWDAMTLDQFTCPAAMRANISISNGVPTWRYRYFGVFPDTIIQSNPNSGAFHASELAIIFDIPPQGSGIPDQTAAQMSFGSYMRGAWATFAKDPVNGLTTYGGGWPTYSPSENTLIQLAFQNMTGTNLAPGNMYDMCNTTFAVNITSSGNSTVGGPTPTASTTPSPSSITSSAVNSMTIGHFLFPIAFAVAAYLWY